MYKKPMDFKHTYSVLSLFRRIRPGEKVSVSITGALAIEEDYPLRGVMRRIRRDGFRATIASLNELAVSTVLVYLNHRDSLSQQELTEWSTLCAEVMQSLRCLSDTYRLEENDEHCGQLEGIAQIMGDCALRFINIEPPKPVLEILTSSPIIIPSESPASPPPEVSLPPPSSSSKKNRHQAKAPYFKSVISNH